MEKSTKKMRVGCENLFPICEMLEIGVTDAFQ